METEAEISGVPAQRPMKKSPTAIGNHPLSPETMMMGFGFDPKLSEGSLKPPIFLTSTFVFETAADGKRFFEGITGKRPGGAEDEKLEKYSLIYRCSVYSFVVRPDRRI